jgi:hypothetical protein
MTNVDYSLRTYFQDKIKDKEPNLFLTTKTPGKSKVDSYSRACQSAQKRQPVILTRPEYEKIGTQYPEFLDEARHAVYGTGPEKYYYICPQYWDTRTNMPLSEKDMKDNNLYSHIIDDTQKKLTIDKYIYHLNDHGKLNQYPNFIIKNGQCAPCCFNKHNTPKAKHQKQTCNQSFEPPSKKSPDPSVNNKAYTPNKTMKLKKVREDTTTFQPITPPQVQSDITTTIKNIKKDIKSTKELIKGSDYIKNADKFPLDHTRLGFLPKPLTNLFEVDISRCMYIQDHKGVSSDYDCILRSGIVINRTQSFLECIADMYGISIDALKFRIYEYLTIDNFIRVQNGNLVNAFYDTDIDTSAFLTDYNNARETSKLYSVLILDDTYSDQVMAYNHIYFDKVFVSYINFIHNYLFKTSTYVDHTFMWDIILQLYDINLCIFEIKTVPSGQETEEIVNMLCPPNRYSMQVLHPNLKHDIAFIIKKNEYYEPVYIFRTFNKETKKIKFFNDKQTSVIYTVQLLKKLIQNIGRNCSVQETTNISVYELYRALSYKQYVVTHKVMDYSTKIIGLRVSDRTQSTAVIPCLPNTIIESDYNISTIPIKLVTSDTVWNSFIETVRFYNTLFTTFGNSSFVDKLPKLQYTLLDETRTFVVGFITQHNQLIEVTDRVEYNDVIRDKYPEYTGKFMTYMEEQAVSLTTVTNVFSKDLISDITHTDITRNRISSEVLLETIQYALFRNIIKTWIRKSPIYRPWVFKLVEDGQEHIKNRTFTDDVRAELMNNMISVLDALSHDEEAGHTIIFMDEVPTGFIDTLTSFDIDTATMVYLSKQYHNDENYYIKIAEEILFNNRMRKYILSETQLSFYKQSFDVNSEEILLNELSINEYYDKIDYHPLAKYTKYSYYDEVGQYGEDANQIKDEYNHIITNDVIDVLCETPSYVTVPSTSFVKRIMHTSIQPNIMQHVFSCIYSIIEIIMSDMILYIPEFSAFVKKTSGEIRADLTKLYSTYDANINITASIYRILTNEGKLNVIKYLKSINELTISNIVNTPTYTLSLLDYWILCIGYDIPAVVINERLSMASRFSQSERFVWICNRKKYTTIPERFFCILGTGSIEVGEKKVYTLLSKSTEGIDRLFTLEDFLPKMQDTLRDTFNKSIDVSEYINKFVITPIKIHSKSPRRG